MLSLRESQALITQACGLVNGDDRPSVSALPSQSGAPLNLRAATVSAAPLSGGNTPRTPRTPRTPHTPIVEKDTFTPVWKRGTVSSFPVTPRHSVTDDAAVRSSEVHVHPQPAMNSHHSATHQAALTTQTDRAHRTDGLTNIEAVARELPEPDTTYEDKCLDAGADVVLERFTDLCYDLARVNLSRAMSRKSLDLDADDLLRAIYILEKENELRSMKLQAVGEELAALEEHKLEVVTESFKQQGVGGNSSGLSDVGYPSSSKPIGGVGGLRGLGGPQSKSSQGLAAAVFGLQPSQSGGGYDRGDQSPSEPGSLSQAQKRPAIPGPLTHQTSASAFSATGGTGGMEGHQIQNQPAGQMNQMNNGSFGGGHPSLQRGQSGVAPSSSSFAGPSQSLGRETSLTLGSAAGGAAGGAFDSLSQGGGGGGGGGFAPASGFVMSGNSQATPSSKDTKQSHHAHQHDPGRLRRGDGGGDLIVGGLTAGGRHANTTDATDSSRHQGGRGYIHSGGGGDARLQHQASSSSNPHHRSMLDGSRAGRGVPDHASMRGHRAQFSSGHYDPNNTNASAAAGTRSGLGGKAKPPVPIVQYAVGRSTASASAHGNLSKAFDEKWARQAARMHA